MHLYPLGYAVMHRLRGAWWWGVDNLRVPDRARAGAPGGHAGQVMARSWPGVHLVRTVPALAMLHIRRKAPILAAMPYDYQAQPLPPPTPADVRSARLGAGLTQAAAAAMVHRADSARWREWERDGRTGRVIDPAVWELFLIKSGLRVCT